MGNAALPHTCIHARMVRTKVLMAVCAGLAMMSWKVAQQERQKPEPCMAT